MVSSHKSSLSLVRCDSDLDKSPVPAIRRGSSLNLLVMFDSVGALPCRPSLQFSSFHIFKYQLSGYASHIPAHTAMIHGGMFSPNHKLEFCELEMEM